MYPLMGPLNQASGCPSERLCSWIWLGELALPGKFLDGMCGFGWLYYPGATEFVTLFFFPESRWCLPIFKRMEVVTLPSNPQTSLSLKGCTAPKGRKELVRRNHRAIDDWVKLNEILPHGQSPHPGSGGDARRWGILQISHLARTNQIQYLRVCVCVKERETIWAFHLHMWHWLFSPVGKTLCKTLK